MGRASREVRRRGVHRNYKLMAARCVDREQAEGDMRKGLA